MFKKIFFITLLLFSSVFFAQNAKADDYFLMGNCECQWEEKGEIFDILTSICISQTQCVENEDVLWEDKDVVSAVCTFAKTEEVKSGDTPKCEDPKEEAEATKPPAGSPGATSPITSKPSPSVTAEEQFKAGEEAAKGVTRVELGNPLRAGRVDIRTILGDIVSYAMGILGSVTLLVFIFGGFMWLTSAGSAEKVKKGSQTMLWAVVGLFLIFGSYAIMSLVLEGIGAKQQKGSTVPASTLNIPK